MSSTMRVAWLAVALLAGVQAGACADEDDFTETVEMSFPLNPGGEFSLSNKNGSFELTTWDKSEVKIVAQKVMRLDGGGVSWLLRLIGLRPTEVKTDAEARKLFEGLVVNTTGDETKREVTTVYPESISGVNFSVAYVVTAPKNVNVRAELTNGAARITGVEGDVDVQSVNGAVSLEDVTGRMEARSTNGRVRIEDARGDVVGRTTNGSVSASLASGESGTVELNSVNGSVSLRVPEGAAFVLNARTVHGGISCEPPLDTIEEDSRKELRGSAGTGGPQYTLRTTNGSVKIQR